MKVCLQCCLQVLEKDSSNVKALFRRAQAFMVTQDHIEARQDLDLAIKLDPTNRCSSTLSLDSANTVHSIPGRKTLYRGMSSS